MHATTPARRSTDAVGTGQTSARRAPPRALPPGPLGGDRGRDRAGQDGRPRSQRRRSRSGAFPTGAGGERRTGWRAAPPRSRVSAWQGVVSPCHGRKGRWTCRTIDSNTADGPLPGRRSQDEELLQELVGDRPRRPGRRPGGIELPRRRLRADPCRCSSAGMISACKRRAHCPRQGTGGPVPTPSPTRRGSARQGARTSRTSGRLRGSRAFGVAATPAPGRRARGAGRRRAPGARDRTATRGSLGACPTPSGAER